MDENATMLVSSSHEWWWLEVAVMQDAGFLSEKGLHLHLQYSSVTCPCNNLNSNYLDKMQLDCLSTECFILNVTSVTICFLQLIFCDNYVQIYFLNYKCNKKFSDTFFLNMQPVWPNVTHFFSTIFLENVTCLKMCIFQLICRDNYKYEVTSPNGAQGSHEQLQLEVSQHFDLGKSLTWSVLNYI